MQGTASGLFRDSPGELGNVTVKKNW